MMAQAAKMHGIVWACVAALWLVLILGGTGVIAYQAKIRETQTATLLVDQLLAVEGSKVPAALEELASYRPWAEPVLRKQYADAQPQSRARLRLALALLPVDDTKVAELLDQLSSVHPGDFAVVRDALLPYQASLVEPLWKLALDTTRKEQPRFQAACALATYAPTDARWSLINKFVAGRLVTRESSAVVIWRSTLQPAKAQLVGPLTSIFRNPARKEAARTYAAGSLVYYAADEPEQLFNLLADSEPFQFPVVFEALYMHTEEAIGLAKKELAKRPPEKASEDEKESLARRQANSAVALYRLGDTDQIWPMLTFTPDPRVRSYLVHWFGPLGGDLQAVVQRLETERDVSIRRALVLMLGEFSKSQLATLPREPLLEKLLSIYQNEPDAGLHGAVEWLLRQWGQGSMLASLADKLKVDDAQLRARPASDKRRWYVNTQRQTFVMVDGHDFLLGSPDSEPDHLPQEHQYRCELNRRFAISEYEITKSQYRAFQREVKTLDLANSPELTDVVRTDDSPQTLTTWYEAAHYCNWLSKQEGIPREQWCYEPNKRGAYRAGMKAKKGYLKLTGYRLPTEAEWEFVCRAETLTSRYYGFAESLLPQYAWYQSNSQNRTWPVGTLKPNDFGLFDLLGNALEWCFDGYEEHPGQASGTKDSSAISIDPAERRVLRGGALNDLSPIVRSATRYYLTPENRYYFIGFRPARTLP
jgi:formylglycine-generating enzyme required for sulfatase activity